MMPIENTYKQLGHTFLWSFLYKSGGIHLCAAALPGTGVLLVWKQMVLSPPKSYQKLCLLFSDGCNTLPKFREIG